MVSVALFCRFRREFGGRKFGRIHEQNRTALAGVAGGGDLGVITTGRVLIFMTMTDRTLKVLHLLSSFGVERTSAHTNSKTVLKLSTFLL